jgi:pyruvate carboxylase
VRVADQSRKPLKEARRKADAADAGHVGAPMPGLVVALAVKPGDRIAKGEVVANLEAMKMQISVVAEKAGTVQEICVAIGNQVDAKDLLAVIA